MWGTIISAVAGIGKNYLKHRAQKEELADAKHARNVERALKGEVAEFEADKSRFATMIGSWKDEYIVIILSIPAILCFWSPESAQLVKDGFEALEKAPDWYTWLLIAVFGANAGVPMAKKTVDVISSIRNAYK